MSKLLVGKGKVSANLKASRLRAETAAGAGLYTLANIIMTDAKRRSPVDTGTMRSSGYVSLPQKVNGRVTVETGFGGPSEDYVVVQHEDLSLKHPTGEPKFLENALLAAKPSALQRLKEFVSQAFKRNAGASGGIHNEKPE